MADQDPFRPFQPRRGRLVATVLAVLAIVIFTLAGALTPATPSHDFHVPDRIFFAAIGWAMALLFWRYATIKAIPSPEGLLVRNLFTTRRVTWPEVVGVQFGHGMPWPSLELNDTETLAVMAVQRSDGASSVAEAQRLAALVQALGEARER
jgi:hypothetical protein